MKMLSDIIKVLFESLRLDDEPVNILINGQLHDITNFYFDEKIMEYVMELTTGYEYEDKVRFKYFEDSSEILDEETGYTYYCPNKEIVELLNKINK